jgi:PKD repeat protein
VVDNNRTCTTNTTNVTIYGSTYNIKPIPDAGGPYSGEVSAIVVFDGSKSYDEDGSIKNYTWTYGDGTASYDQITTHVFYSPGTHIVTLTVTDNFGGQNSTFAQVSIQSTAEDKSPGFELILIISVMMIILVWKRKRR